MLEQDQLSLLDYWAAYEATEASLVKMQCQNEQLTLSALPSQLTLWEIALGWLACPCMLCSWLARFKQLLILDSNQYDHRLHRVCVVDDENCLSAWHDAHSA